MPFNFPENESIIVFFRRHWYVYFTSAFPSLLIFLFLSVVIIVGGGYLAPSFDGIGTVISFIIAAVFLIEWSFLFTRWINYSLDLWIITTSRVFDVDQKNYFSRDVSEFRLDRIQDITVEVKGMIPTLLNFGDIHIQTAGKSRDFIFKQVPDPYGVRNRISQEVDRVLLKESNRSSF